MPEWLQKIISSKSKTFLAFCFCFIFGAGIFSFLNNNNFLFFSYASIFVILFFIIIFWRKKLARFLLLCLFIFILGGLRFLITIPEHNSSRVEYYNGSKVGLQGWISAEPSVSLTDTQYIVSVYSLADKKVSGKVIIKTKPFPQYQYGDELAVSCSLQQPKIFVDFNYQKYLAKAGVWSVCLKPKIESLGINKGNFFLKKMFWFKSIVQNQMSRLWPEPQNSLMAGLLYGSKSQMPQVLIDNFTRTGVSHIIAVSGYNVSIIVVMLNVVLIYVGLSRRQSFWFLNFLILSFVFFSGATASVVRAGVMAGIVLFAQHIGRLSVAGRTLVYAAVVMLLFNPYVLIWDVGFQLSFLSTIGLVYLAPILKFVIASTHRGINYAKQSQSTDSGNSGIATSPLAPRNDMWGVLLEILVTTISAIIATLPIIIFQFGRLSLVAPLVNVLVLWLVPWLMLFGFVSLIFSCLFFPLGQGFAWIAGFGLNYVIIIVNWFGGKSWSAINIQIPVWIMLAMYAWIIYFIIANSYGQKS